MSGLVAILNADFEIIENIKEKEEHRLSALNRMKERILKNEPNFIENDGGKGIFDSLTNMIKEEKIIDDAYKMDKGLIMGIILVNK
ncbi:MAG: hypothetical protein ACI8Q1_001855 [Parvicella sp.]|jgi:hypothetical protein